MNRYVYFFALTALSIACSSPEKGKEQSQKAPKPKVSQPAEKAEETPKEDQYKLVLKHVDNRAVIYINDSTIFDTGNMQGGPYEKEIDLTKFMNPERTELKVELYNTNPPQETVKPGWMIVYDIFVNDELVEFINEKKNEAREGVVYTETYDLNDIW